jgi:LmbE family N-acetylglucosaminyl deacetylase
VLDLTQLVVVSPHCDDAVFACGDLICAHPGTVVVTVFTAAPRIPWLRSWDRDCGFEAGDDVMHVRREEDRQALALLGARPVWLPFRDDQYGRDADALEVANALSRAIGATAATAVLVPLGLFHRDHQLAHDGAVAARTLHPALNWLVYADALYRALPEDPVGDRLRELTTAGFTMERVLEAGGDASVLKRRAIDCYRSQLRGLATDGRMGHADAFAPETYWRFV